MDYNELFDFLSKHPDARTLVCEAFVSHVMYSSHFNSVVDCIRILDRVDPRYIDFLMDCDFVISVSRS